MPTERHRILIADDLPALHEDYRRILAGGREEAAPALAAAAKFAPDLAAETAPLGPVYELTCVRQGEEAVAAADAAKAAGRPFALAFIDVRMPPGADGVETATQLRLRHPELQIVLCTAYSDYSWHELSRAFPDTDGVLLLKKPFDPTEVRQLAHALCRKWTLAADNAALLSGLEARVSERTAQLALASEQLAQALRAAQAADRAKADFLRCISHELNTPLNGVQGAASVLDLADDPQVREMGRVILSSSQRLNRLFTRILLYLELDAPPPLASTPLQPAHVLASAVEPHRAAAEKKGLTFHVSLAAPPRLQLRGRADLFATALENLVENAIKFTSVGGVWVHLRHSPEKQTLAAEIVDTGVGLEPAKLDNLAALFSPGDASVTRRQEGAGIGLALVARIARHLGGSVSARAGDPAGSVFTFTVPCNVG